MSVVFEAMKLLAVLFVLAKSVIYAVWCIKSGNAVGGAAVIMLCLAAVVLFIRNEVGLYI